MDYKISKKMIDMKPSAIREIFKSLSDPSIIAFAAGNPAPESFPSKEFGILSAEIFRDSPELALQYSITEGYPPLRKAVADRLDQKFGIGRDFDNTIIVSGGQQGIELACKVMCNEGDSVICENPSFIGSLNAFRSLGTNVVGVPVDDDGINIEALEQTLKNTPNAKLLYVIPNFQNPSGITMSLKKRCDLYELALRYGLVIVEDNPYGELRFAGRDLPSIKSMDTEGIVIYCGSFSKILSSGMRVGFVCAPDALVQKMVVAKQVEDVHTNIFFQMLCAKYIERYDLDAHIEDIRTLYRNKCTLMLDMLDKYMPSCVKYTRPEGGLFVWCTLPDFIELNDFVKKALEKKVAVVPGTAFNCDTKAPSNSFRLNYSTPSEEQIERGIKIISDIIKDYLN